MTMAEQNMQSLNAAVEETIDLAHQAIEQTRAEIARSQALSQADADLAHAIERMVDNHDRSTHEQ
ncbi:hypothetical protein [Microvirga aerophila]|uniref:Uncharacterized protein n=1 Tax=Microvirga aerophila TaxID=670291 RepID=A0A512C5D5_9HYPH|nr:hypothetical protein [Microvirga aerophila]GEO19401.1 hypothetical protein MAE02_70970 [Microvirga aerophila]